MLLRIAPPAAAIVLSITVAVSSFPTAAQAEPVIAEASPVHGDVLVTLPESFHLCFSEPVKVESTNDWKFNVRTPDGKDLGLRIVFQSNGNCVDVYPGAPEDPPQGIWAFDWLVHSQADDSEGSGTINFQLGDLQPDETPVGRVSAGNNADEDDGDDGVRLGLYVVAGVGAAVTLAAVGGFAWSLRRRS